MTEDISYVIIIIIIVMIQLFSFFILLLQLSSSVIEEDSMARNFFVCGGRLVGVESESHIHLIVAISLNG